MTRSWIKLNGNWLSLRPNIGPEVSFPFFFGTCRMLQRKEEDLLKRQAIERRALPKRIRAERKARDMMFRESLRISMISDPEAEREKLKRVSFSLET